MVRDRQFYIDFFSMWIVLVLQNVITLSVNLADNMMLGAYSETALAGVAAVNQIQFVYQQLLISFGEAAVILGTQYFGKRQVKPVKSLAKCAMYFGVALSAALFLAAALIPRALMLIFTSDEAIISRGMDYLRLIRYTYLIFAVSQILLYTLRIVGSVRISLYLSVTALVVNCFFNYALIYGRFGMPSLGVEGAAIATIISRAVELCVLILYIYLREKRLRLSWRDYLPAGLYRRKKAFRQQVPATAVEAGKQQVSTAAGKAGKQQVSAAVGEPDKRQEPVAEGEPDKQQLPAPMDESGIYRSSASMGESDMRESSALENEYRKQRAETLVTGSESGISGTRIPISRLTMDYIRVMLPLMFVNALWGLNNAAQNAILGHMTARAIAANSVASTLFLLVKSTAQGSAATASFFTGKTIGEGAMDRLRLYARTWQVLFILIGIASGITLYFLRIPILSIYQLEPETRKMADMFLMILSVIMVTMSYQMPVNAGIIRGGGDIRYAVTLDLVSIWCIVIPASWAAAFVFHASPIVVVWCLNADQIFKAVPAFLKCNFGHWARELTRT